MTNLFDETALDDGPCLETESSFHFLNRADGPVWKWSRDLLEGWYAAYPDPDGDLRARFRSDDLAQHLAAWWELYIFTLFQRLGFEVEVHPSVPGTGKKPDFRVTRGADGMYVECAATSGDDNPENAPGQAWLCECMNRARNPDFMLDVDITGVGTEQPAVNEIVKPIEQWLASLNYEYLAELFDRGGDVAEQVFDFRDWEVRIRALPVNEESRGRDGRIIAIGPSSGVRVLDETGKIRTVLRKKGSRYGTLNEPLIVALLSWSSFADARELTNAVFGSVAVSYVPSDLESARLIRQVDGYWRPPPSTRGSRIAGVLFGKSRLKPWAAAADLPELWLNPWAPMPVTADLPFGIHSARDNGEITSVKPRTSPQEVFELPPMPSTS